ncbi:KpsF/GutQ family sugar-phosphate isomerase [Allosphingosinicella indica]|uniref:Arabinose-5-phosphate isomerase n=1 Tax=Allosphingosinicella indica TaxID=941907 RepID=A0A1X7GUS0_9SPHN|nr:KpsF/GutQ family sugar-phosphate isomerase [Allosphingosinicella indica]SMF74852.1 arabinose-5-phosphate isomerase [Allosphingosinicella indica]
MTALPFRIDGAAVVDGPDQWFRQVLETERDAITAFIASDQADVTDAVALIAGQERPIVCTGVGKSGLVAAKLAATFSSLGTPALFLNAAEAAHGDLGAVQTGNVVILFSNSGATDEILRILPLLKARGCLLIGIVGRAESPLARAADHLILTEIAREADHIGMAPTASTTLQMAVGDALAVAVSRLRGFTRDDFLRHHPAGLLGRHMIPIRHLMRSGEDMPTVLPHASVAELIGVMSAKRLGAASVVDHDGRFLGLIVDGDIRRLIQSRQDLYETRAEAIMGADPVTLPAEANVADALVLMQDSGGRFLVLPVVNEAGVLEGMIHTYDLVQA